MKIIGIFGLFALAHIGLCSKGPAITDFTTSLRMFASEFYLKVNSRADPGQNLIFSPTSIAHTVGMILAGAKGDTAREIRRALSINAKKKYSDLNINNLFRKVHNRLFNTRKTNILSKALMASQLFLERENDIHMEYTNILKEYYDSEVQFTDFGAPEVAAQQINDWVANRTEDLITDLVSPDSLTSLTRLVLVNALFFKASWLNGMEREKEPITFVKRDNTTKQVVAMKQNARMKYRDEGDWFEIAIPYNKSEAYLLLIVPKDFADYERRSLRNTLRNLEYDFEFSRSWRITKKMNLIMPLFEIEHETNCKEVMQQLLAKRMFDMATADLSGMSDEPLYVSDFRHKAKIIVDERGTTAAAATDAVLSARSMPPKDVVIDKPFFFGIYRQGHLLFFGRVVDPVAPQETGDGEE